MMSDIIISTDHLSKSFVIGNQTIAVLKDITIEVMEGDFVIIVGPSGSGKSTLLHSLLGLEPPTSGKVFFRGKNLYTQFPLEDDRSEFRKQHIGMVYQQPNWVKSLNVVENTAFPMMLLGHDLEEMLPKAHKLLGEFGLSDWAENVPSELSSGQQQKVALMRALITNPSVIIADEPTGNLDYLSSQNLMKLLLQLNEKQQKTIILVTHDLEYLRYAKTAIQIMDGQVIGVYRGQDKKKLVASLKAVAKKLDETLVEGVVV